MYWAEANHQQASSVRSRRIHNPLASFRLLTSIKLSAPLRLEPVWRAALGQSESKTAGLLLWGEGGYDQVSIVECQVD